MHHDAEDARPGDSRRLAQLDEVERPGAAVHERMNDGVAERGIAERLGDFAIDHLAGEVVERIFALPPSRIARRMPRKRRPEIAAAIAEHHDRARRRID